MITSINMLDVWSYITELIEDDKDKCRLMMTCKWISKCRFYFNQMNTYEKILRSRWFDHFTNVLVNKKIIMRPILEISSKEINNKFPSNMNNPTFAKFVSKFPLNMTHLTFEDKFNKSVKKCIPSTVTHLTFGDYFSHPIKDSIPSSVTHLIFGDSFDYQIKNFIPSSVKYLEFGYSFNKNIKGCIPASVTHLILGSCFDNSKLKGCIPPSVTHLTLDPRFELFNYDDIPSTVTHLYEINY